MVVIMKWNFKQIRSNARRTVFSRGAKPWFTLVCVAFLFAFIGVSNINQLDFIDLIDEKLGAVNDSVNSNIEILKAYIIETPIVKDIPLITSEAALGFIDILSRSSTWVIKLLGANLAYFKRNQGEVIANMIIAAVITAAVKLFIQNAAVIGSHRFAMECRFSKDVPFRRIMAPFHSKSIFHLIGVMFIYKTVLALWSFTVIGGIYKYYQYCMVPYILAENPSVGWKEAKKLSAQMTKGYKMKIFLTQLSYLHIWIVKAIPIIGLLVSVPMEMALGAEMYFALRSRSDIDRKLFVEKAFSGKPCYAPGEDGSVQPQYVLQDLSIQRPRLIDEKSVYTLLDYVIMFFAFCFIGWIWECGLYIVRDHLLINRGSMYGPWIPIYGVGGTSVVLLLDRFKDNKPRLFLLSVGLCGILEYASSFILDFMFNSSYWNYKADFMNLNGRIYLAGLIAFGIGSMGGIYLFAPTIKAFIEKHSRKLIVSVAVILTVLFLTDLLICFKFGFNSGASVGGSI